ncbi:MULTISPECIES: acyl carrier protein [unclassified Streptomyces]|uniref:acyl carrier protein n=1 Tax=unclassified Streptomyces TaxID=2593676 RepID=UPI00225A6901|nr:acyl carrier protein [Streptomyces sp. NBC_01571]MCX4576060.1 acyl carrier protein [Streptomyces sp. NBC_01571]WSS85573.1 acyl carrier protein [Streptomyces sp. NBC_01176]
MSYEELKNVLVSLGLSEDDISPDATREEAGLDSIAVVELALVLRREKGVAVTEEEIGATHTVADVAALVGAR